MRVGRRFKPGFLALCLLGVAIGLIVIACEDSADCSQDAECWGQKHWVDAETRCAPHIENMARYDYDWTDGVLGWKFDQWRWGGREAGIMTYRGDNIKFQNGFGAWQRISYECDYNTETKIVVDARAYEQN